MRTGLISRALLVVCSFVLSAAVLAESDPTDLIKYRKNVMSALGGHAGAASMIIRGKVDYAPQLIDHARSLALTATTIKDIFPPDSELGDTNAKAAVWEKPDEFKQHAMDTQEAAAAFLKAVEAGDKAEMGKKFLALGKTCKSCHDQFRKEEKK
ncbi:MAG: cytochrome c [Chromatiaceae bacterium]